VLAFYHVTEGFHPLVPMLRMGIDLLMLSCNSICGLVFLLLCCLGFIGYKFSMHSHAEHGNEPMCSLENLLAIFWDTPWQEARLELSPTVVRVREAGTYNDRTEGQVAKRLDRLVFKFIYLRFKSSKFLLY